MVASFLKDLPSMERSQKRVILIAYDLVAMIVALWAAFSTRLGEVYFEYNALVVGAAGVSFAAGIAALYRLNVYHVVLRYFDLRILSRIVVAATVSAITWVVLVYYTRAQMVVDGIVILVPRSVGFIYCGFLFLLLFFGRYVMANILAAIGRDMSSDGRGRRSNVAIYGANAAGISVAESMRGNPDYRLKAFIEEDPALRGQIVAGVPIYSPEALPELAASARLDQVFLALPTASRSQRLSAISRLTKLNIQVKTVPAPEEIVSGRFTVSDVRPIIVNDLLRRDPVEPLTELMQQAVEDQSILITGAGGSIGSEICRQILRARPRKMVLLDQNEFGLYSIEQQLIENAQSIPAAERPKLVPIIGSMLNERLIGEVIRDFGIDSIYHAAAYKHVPLLEQNEVVGVENNVLGTLALARAAFKANLKRFTMISTDKAVRPENVMGASKRVAELVVQAYAHHEGCKTRFGIVRFGNVLDSSGSVVQRFRSQISRGGPVTVTHKEVTRFFMSIPEATQLVLQASAMAEHGEVFVLDMGEPVKISDLAKNMIRLSGMTVRDENNPDGDIEVVYVGLRPGEKLYEELFLGADPTDTTHPRIKMARERLLPLAELEPHLDRLLQATKAGDAAAVRSQLDSLLAPDRITPPSNVAVLKSIAAS